MPIRTKQVTEIDGAGGMGREGNREHVIFQSESSCHLAPVGGDQREMGSRVAWSFSFSREIRNLNFYTILQATNSQKFKHSVPKCVWSKGCPLGDTCLRGTGGPEQVLQAGTRPQGSRMPELECKLGLGYRDKWLKLGRRVRTGITASLTLMLNHLNYWTRTS